MTSAIWFYLILRNLLIAKRQNLKHRGLSAIGTRESISEGASPQPPWTPSQEVPKPARVNGNFHWRSWPGRLVSHDPSPSWPAGAKGSEQVIYYVGFLTGQTMRGAFAFLIARAANTRSSHRRGYFGIAGMGGGDACRWRRSAGSAHGGTSTTPGHPNACDDALGHVAFRYTNNVGIRNQFSIAAQWFLVGWCARSLSMAIVRSPAARASRRRFGAGRGGAKGRAAPPSWKQYGSGSRPFWEFPSADGSSGLRSCSRREPLPRHCERDRHVGIARNWNACRQSPNALAFLIDQLGHVYFNECSLHRRGE
jgi:hypothetical protein